MKTEKIRQVFGERVRWLRHKKGLSQENFAAQCGLHRTFIGRVERGETNVTLDTVVKLAAGLGVSLAKIFSSFNNEQNET